MKRVYICHPYRANPEENIKKVEKIVADIGLETLERMRHLENTNWQLSDTTMGDVYRQYTVDELYAKYGDELVCPVSVMLAFPAAMNAPTVKYDHEDQELSFCVSILEVCDELWVYSRDLSDGMVYEVQKASELGIKVVWKV